MYKKLIAMILACTMLVSISPAVAADNASASPTVEEILAEYHKTAFEEKRADEVGTAMAYSLRNGTDGKTLEQETVDTLNSAGYEAYNVTSANYSTLENQLQTDFSDIGLDPNGSYIIVVTGEDSATNDATGNNTRAVVPAPDPGGDYFIYTYNGTTYKMRYVTVTGSDNSYYTQASYCDLLENYGDSFLDRLLDAGITAYIDALNQYVSFGTILSILGLPDYVNRYETSTSILRYDATSQWTRSYIQVWEASRESWVYASCVEFVDMESELNGKVFDKNQNDYIDIDESQINQRVYSSNYSNYNQRKQDAVLGYTMATVIYNKVGNITYRYDNTVVAYHSGNFV